MADLAVFWKEMLIIGLAMVWNIDDYLRRDARMARKGRTIVEVKGSLASEVSSEASRKLEESPKKEMKETAGKQPVKKTKTQ